MSINRINIESIHGLLAQGATVLVPNNRLRDAVFHAYADSLADEVFRTPRVLGIDVWVREIWDEAASRGYPPYCELLPVSATEELFLWTELIEDSLARYPLLNPEETANQVSRAYQLMKQWQLHVNQREDLQAYSTIPDIAAFLSWTKEFEALCKERNVISLVDCIEQIAGDLNAENSLPLPDDVVLLNFYQPPPLYTRLFKLLENRTRINDIKLAMQSGLSTGQHIEFPSPQAEYVYVARWAEETLAGNPLAHIGLVGELSESQRSEFERTLSATLNSNSIVELCSSKSIFNSTYSPHSLMDEGLVHDAFLLFEQVNEEQQAESFCRLLRSPFVLPDSDEQIARSELERELRARVTSRCRTRDLLFYAGREDRPGHCPALSSAMLSVREQYRRFSPQADPRKWGTLLHHILRQFSWPGETLTPHQQLVRLRFQNVIDELAALTPVLGTIDYPTLIARLRNICIRAKHQQQFDSRRQISLYSIDEASGLNFDHVWILNFNDQVWPPAISPSPFLPYALQKDAGLPGSHSDIQYSLASETFNILSRSVTRSLNSSHHHSDGEQEFRASSFALAFEHVEDSADSHGNQQDLPRYGRELQATPSLSLAEDELAVPLEPGTQSLGGHSVLSDQARCPFHAFILHRLHAEPLESFAIGLTRASRGEAMHKALEYLFGQIPDRQSIADMDEAKQSMLCDAAADQAISFLRRIHQALMTPRFERIEKQRLSQLLRGFLVKELERAEFSIIAREQRQSWTYRDMVFNLKLDRIDRLADGSLAVIDYKTGKTVASLASWLGDRPQDLQLPFYSTVMNAQQNESVAAIVIAHVNAERTDYSGIMAQQEFHRSLVSVSEKLPGGMDWPTLNRHFQSKLEEIADEFRDGIAIISPADYSESCSDFQIRALCRVPGRDVPSTAEPSE